ncbi:NCS2 family permease [Acidaminobacter hydrogenoformans]|uniref:Putative MFS transporter, AGZA family, xanthine/uracil permease n=1 Tax=Acidaminobacter hydrogenoformans DSM 2784 TaxID=1120920 RepID=A0A1G5S600_9FIRM|nr:NCS2 family permease [Acidaminobacter hydrogenoformans]SCZ81628.1 putative MFS transporter, AGZA family, xanthine/uracil permease [Acidaminobacter hydrogenoformans DSM 2784]
MTNNSGFFEKFFKLSEHGTNAKTEVLAGITTFMTMAYILIVNPLILADAGMDFGAVFTATALASLVATLVMAFYANLPFVLAPGMGLNAFFAYTVVLTMGYSWQFALTAVFIEGIIFLILTFFNVREAIIDSIPQNIKKAVSVGIGLFIAFIGLYNSGIVIQGAGVPLSLGDFVANPNTQVALAGLVITGVLLALKVKGAILLGIIISTILSIPLGVAQLPGSIFSMPPAMNVFAFEFDKILTADMWIVLGTFLFVDMFDTIGTLIGVSTKANMLDENGKLPGVKKALFADAIGTTFGAMVGTSTVTTYVESASGVAEGGRTGMTALVSAGLFFVALFISPLFIMIPGAATAPALIIVGLFMMSPIKEIDLDDFTEAIPAFLTIIMMPFAYSIAEGIVFGIVSYALIKTLAGKSKEVPIVTYVLAVLFILKEIFA